MKIFTKEQAPSRPFIIIIASISAVTLLAIILVIILIGRAAPKGNNLDAFQGFERRVAETSLSHAISTSGPTISRPEYRVLSVKQVKLDSRCNDTIGDQPTNIQSLPTQRFAVSLVQQGLGGIFASPFEMYVCVY